MYLCTNILHSPQKKFVTTFLQQMLSYVLRSVFNFQALVPKIQLFQTNPQKKIVLRKLKFV